MFSNPAPKLAVVLVILAVCLIATVTGLPGQSGFLSSERVMALGPDLKGGTTLIYNVESYEVTELEKRIDRLERLRDSNPDRFDQDTARTLSALEDQLTNEQAAWERNREQAFSRTREVLQNRLDRTGLAAIDVVATGQDQLEITLPSHQELDQRIRQILTLSGQLFFRMEADKPNENALQGVMYPDNPDPSRYRYFSFSDAASSGANDWGTDETGRQVVLIDFQPPYAVVNGDDLDPSLVTASRPDPTNPNSKFPVAFGTVAEKVDAMRNMTTMFNVRTNDRYTDTNAPRMCIVFNEKVEWAGVIRDVLPGRGVMTGFDTNTERQTMIQLIQSGSLPVSLTLESESQRGAALGQDAIQQGFLSMGIGGALVVLFILAYYLGPGLVAVFALAGNLVVIIAVMVLFAPAATLTMPGIAGIILTVGMAIDANILIFERIREEKRRLTSLREAIERGFNRSADAILDANITTALTGLILLVVGTAEIRGFATTLVIGIGATLFTTLVFGRFAIAFLVSTGALKRFAMLRMIGNTKVPFMKFRGAFFLASTLIIAITLAFFGSRGRANLGIDFLGGHAFLVQLNGDVDVSDVRTALAEIPDEDGTPKYPEAQVTPAFPPGEVAGQTRSARFELRFPLAVSQGEEEVDPETARRRIQQDIQELFNGSALPQLVSTGVSVEPQEVTKLGFEVRIPLTREPAATEEALLGTVTSPKTLGQVEAADGTFLEAWQVFSNVGTMPLSDSPDGATIEDLAATADDRAETDTPEGEEAFPVPQLRIGIEGQDLLILVGNLRVDSATLANGLEGITAESGLAERLRALERRITYLTAQEFLPNAEFNDPAWSISPSGQPVTTRAIPEGGTINVSYRFNHPMPLSRWDLEDANGRYTGGEALTLAAEDNTEGNARQKLQDRVDGTIVGTTYTPVAEGKAPTLDGFTLQLSANSFRSSAAPQLDPTASRSAAEGISLADRVSQATSAVREFLADPSYGFNSTIQQPFLLADTKGPKIAEGLRDKATLAILLSLAAVVLYIWIRFRRFSFGLGATIALAHDIMFALGMIAVIDAFTNFNVSIDLTVVAALLTIIGYSLNDTIVIYDRIRENRSSSAERIGYVPIINTSVNQTLSRTLLTSLTTFVVVAILALFGGPALQGFALTLLVGIVVGTYSSVFVASPLLAIDWAKYQGILYGALGLGGAWWLTGVFVPDVRIIWFDADIILNLAVYMTVLFLLATWFTALMHFLFGGTDEQFTGFLDRTRRKVVSADEARAQEEQAGPMTEAEELATAESEAGGATASATDGSASNSAPESTSDDSKAEEEGGDDEQEEEAEKPAPPSASNKPAANKPAGNKKQGKGGRKGKKR